MAEGSLTLEDEVSIPQHVVFRAFIAETVVLNLQTGKYHGLNPTAGRMLEVIGDVGSLQEAANRLAEQFGQPRETIEEDLLEFCRDLRARGMIEVRANVDG